MDRRQFLAQAAAMGIATQLPDLGRHRRRPRYRPPALGIHLDQVPQLGLEPLTDAEQVVGPVDIVHWFQAWGSGGWADPHPEWLDTVTAAGHRPLVTWEPWAYVNDRIEWGPDSIVNGFDDTYITAWARTLAAWGRPVWLRFMHECNGTWYPWGGGDPTVYIAAWRHVHQLFRAAGARNVKWVWCPLVDDVGPHPFEAYYPGRRYVDVLALDGYNWGELAPENGGWRTPDQVFTGAYDRLARLGGQPVWLAEVGCAPEGGDKAAWVTGLYQLCRAELRRVQSVVWFSLDKEQDWRVHVDPAVGAVVQGA